MIDLSIFEALFKENRIVDIRTDLFEEGDLRGTIIQFNEDLLLLELYNESIEPDGYVVMRIEDVTFIRWDDREQQLWEGVIPPLSNVRLDLDNFVAVLQSLEKMNCIFSVHRQDYDEERLYLCKNFMIIDESIILDTISLEGFEEGKVAFEIGDISRIDFGNKYQNGLLKLIGSSDQIN